MVVTKTKKPAVKKASTKAPEKPVRKRAHAKEEVPQRLRIRVMAYEHKLLDASVKQIIDIAHRSGVEVVGPVPLPTEVLKYTVNRSTFVHKNAREQFEMRVHKRLIDIIQPTSKTIDALNKLSLPAGVDIKIKASPTSG